MACMNTFSALNILLTLFSLVNLTISNEDAKRLLDDLFSDYNSVVRPVANPTDIIRLKIGLKLSQIADIDEKNQIMTTNVWLRHEWCDQKLIWEPAIYGNITKINIPSTHIWLPDVVLYNNADGDYQITTKTKATVHYDGRIIWDPPMIYKSYCSINIEYYPFDIQDCYMKFGTWTFDGTLINLEHISTNDDSLNNSQNNISEKGTTKLYIVEWGIDISDYYQSVEWDLLSIPAQKNIKVYDCCTEPFFDIYFNITIRRKTLFYTVNLIIPCVNISFLSVLVFYLPSDSGEKLTLGISILVALLVFYLLLIELIPPTSLVIPLLGKYLLFTLILVNLSILLTIFILNLHHRKPNTHKMPVWMKRLFIDTLPKLLMIERPTVHSMRFQQQKAAAAGGLLSQLLPACLRRRSGAAATQADPSAAAYSMAASYLNSSATEGPVVVVSDKPTYALKKNVSFRSLHLHTSIESGVIYPKNIIDALHGIEYINTQMQKESDDNKEIDDWKYASMVIDRLLLYIFTVACLMGTFGILLQAPSIYDDRKPLLKNSFKP